MAKDKTTLRFWLRTDRANKDGTSPIHLIYQIQGNRKYFSVPGIKLFSVNWDPDQQKAIYQDKKSLKKLLQATEKEKQNDIETGLLNLAVLLSSNEVEEINFKLSQVRSDIADIEKHLELQGKQITTDIVIQKYDERQSQKARVKRIEPSVNVADFIERYSQETKAVKKGTVKEYISIMNHIRRFEAATKQSFTFAGIDVALLKSFHHFMLQPYELVSKKKNKRVVQINNITAAKLLSTLKTLLRRAEDEYDYAVNPKYRKFKNPHPRRDSEFEVIALTQDELDAVYNLDLSNNKRLDQARDIFVFSCHTGLRYSDLRQLRKDHIKKDFFIRMASSEKNSKKIEVPLTPVSFAILQKYAERLMPLPVSKTGSIMSDQKLNQFIKEIGQLAEIDTPVEVVREYGTEKKAEMFKKHELLSIHVGRKTYTSLSLEKGIPLQDVMSLTTHTSFKAVKRYINVTKDQKKAAVAKAWGAVKDENKLKAV